MLLVYTQQPVILSTMKRLFTILSLAALTLVAAPRASAQDFGGTTFNNDILTFSDLYNLSFTAHNYGTARSMAMGNAFTALGADLTAATLNPAGIGMYVDSDISFSPMMQFTKMKTANSEPFYGDGPTRNQPFSDHTERFGLSSAGGVFTVYRGTGALTNFNLGIVYNRIADFNYNSLSASIANPAHESMANFLCTLSNTDNLQTNDDGRMPFGDDPYYWGSVLAYQNYIINKDDQGWYIDRISADAEIDQFSATEVRGSIGEYDITFGMNFADVVYFGASLGIQSLSYKRSVFYGENYVYPNGEYPSGEDMPYQLDYMNYVQRTRLSGTGVNLKLGITFRPVSWWRFGVAYHTPTYYNTSLRYSADMWAEAYSAGDNPDGFDVNNNGYIYTYDESPIWEDAGPNAWKFRSPSRLLLGTAFTLGNRVIISADYERSWYQSTRLQDSPIWNLDYTDITKEIFKGSNTVRVGAEAYILPFMALRAGYIWSGSTLRKGFENIVATRRMPQKQSFVTAGLGFRFSPTVYLDLAYQYNRTHYTGHQTFYYTDYDVPENSFGSRVFDDTLDRHIAVVTLGFRF